MNLLDPWRQRKSTWKYNHNVYEWADLSLMTLLTKFVCFSFMSSGHINLISKLHINHWLDNRKVSTCDLPNTKIPPYCCLALHLQFENWVKGLKIPRRSTQYQGEQSHNYLLKHATQQCSNCQWSMKNEKMALGNSTAYKVTILSHGTRIG